MVSKGRNNQTIDGTHLLTQLHVQPRLHYEVIVEVLWWGTKNGWITVTPGTEEILRPSVFDETDWSNHNDSVAGSKLFDLHPYAAGF